MKVKSKRQQNWLVTGLVTGGTVAFLLLIFLPTRRTIDALRAEAERQREFISATNGLLAAIATSEAETAEARKYERRWRAKTPADAEKGTVYERLQLSAKEAGVDTVRFDPLDPVEMQTLRWRRVSLGVSGEFDHVLAWLQSVERMPHVTWVDNLRLERKSGDAAHVRCDALLAIPVDKLEKLPELAEARPILPVISRILMKSTLPTDR